MAAPRWYRPAILAVLAAQLLAALADNALLILAIALLEARQAPAWLTPALRVGFYGAYVLLAPFAGRWADAWPKGRLMTTVSGLKLAGAVALAAGAHPLLVFAAIGCGAAAYAPARYGMLPALCSGRQLLRANAAMEIVTIVAIIGGYALGSALVGGASTLAACAVLALLYGAAAACTAWLRQAGSSAAVAPSFRAGIAVLLADGPARNALTLTSIFWAAAAVLQFLVIAWARETLGLSLARAAILPALFAIGMVGGAVLAGLRHRPGAAWLPALCGLALGGAIVAMPLAANLTAACLLLTLAGLLAGALLVPMNATLQQRGASLMLPGLSVAVQNFFENGLSIAFLAAYGAAVASGAAPNAIIYGLGLLVMVLVSWGAWRRQLTPPTLMKEPRC